MEDRLVYGGMKAVDNADTELERSTESVRHLIRQASTDGRYRLKITYTESNFEALYILPLYR
jgi:hypothetical protein